MTAWAEQRPLRIANPDFIDCHCPNCEVTERPMLAMVGHPTYQEMLDSGRPEGVAEAQRMIARRKAFRSGALRTTATDQVISQRVTHQVGA